MVLICVSPLTLVLSVSRYAHWPSVCLLWRDVCPFIPPSWELFVSSRCKSLVRCDRPISRSVGGSSRPPCLQGSVDERKPGRGPGSRWQWPWMPDQRKGFSSLPSVRGAQRGFLDTCSSFPSPAPTRRKPRSGSSGVSFPSAARQGDALWEQVAQATRVRGPNVRRQALASPAAASPCRRPHGRVGAGGGVEVGPSPGCVPPARAVSGEVAPPAAGASAEKRLYDPRPWGHEL